MKRTATTPRKARTASSALDPVPSAPTGLPATPALPPRRWYVQLALLLTSVLLLSLAFAPVNQFYLAWVGLVPWMLVVASTRTRRAAFAWGFAGAWAFFLANMWWLWFVSPPGLFALTLYLALFWGLGALIVRPLLRREPSSSILHPPPSILTILLIPTAWVAFEWMRGNISFLGKQGLPWLYLGQTQSPILVMCQIADLTSVLGVTFWVVMINALVAVMYVNRHQLRRTIPAVVAVVAMLFGIGVYGAFRMSQDSLYPGPSVLVVQSNYKQSNTGEKGAPPSEIVDFHVGATRQALRELTARGTAVDLVIWSETMMPSLNREAREVLRGTRPGDFWQQAHDEIARLAAEFHTHFLVGGLYNGDWQQRDEYVVVPIDRRNSAYLFDSTGTLSDARYDKIHLVPFGEYIPFKETIPPLYRLFIHLGPNYYEEYVLTRGDSLTVFSLEFGEPDPRTARFVVPICFEDIVPSMITRMLWDPQTGSKRADLLVNITNDGWFRANQMPQHLQAALFRSIENRVPTARSVNTGISGFVDPLGRVTNTVPGGTEGWSVERVQLDRRVAPYTRIGDAFPIICLAVTGGLCVAGFVANRRRKLRPPDGVSQT